MIAFDAVAWLFSFWRMIRHGVFCYWQFYLPGSLFLCGGWVTNKKQKPRDCLLAKLLVCPAVSWWHWDICWHSGRMSWSGRIFRKRARRGETWLALKVNRSQKSGIVVINLVVLVVPNTIFPRETRPRCGSGILFFISYYSLINILK